MNGLLVQVLSSPSLAMVCRERQTARPAAALSFHPLLDLQTALRRHARFSRIPVVILQQMIMDPLTLNHGARGRPPAMTAQSSNAEREAGLTFNPRFDAAGLIGAIVQEAISGEVLMFAFMDAEALAKTRETGLAHFHSRSRGRLWLKGETSGNVLKVLQILVDCDQDALILKVRPAGPACHTGELSCFYRELGPDGLSRMD